MMLDEKFTTEELVKTFTQKEGRSSMLDIVNFSVKPHPTFSNSFVQ